jgi:hypothetical protein
MERHQETCNIQEYGMRYTAMGIRHWRRGARASAGRCGCYGKASHLELTPDFGLRLLDQWIEQLQTQSKVPDVLLFVHDAATDRLVCREERELLPTDTEARQKKRNATRRAVTFKSQEPVA